MIKYGIRQVSSGLFYSQVSRQCDSCEDNATLVDRMDEARIIYNDAHIRGFMLDPHEIVAFAPMYCAIPAYEESL